MRKHDDGRRGFLCPWGQVLTDARVGSKSAQQANGNNISARRMRGEGAKAASFSVPNSNIIATFRPLSHFEEPSAQGSERQADTGVAHQRFAPGDALLEGGLAGCVGERKSCHVTLPVVTLGKGTSLDQACSVRQGHRDQVVASR